MFCVDSLESAPYFGDELLEESGAGLRVELIPACGDVEPHQERQDGVEGQDIERHQFRRLIPFEPVDQFLALGQIVDFENKGQLFGFFDFFREGLGFQIRDLGQPQLQVFQ